MLYTVAQWDVVIWAPVPHMFPHLTLQWRLSTAPIMVTVVHTPILYTNSFSELTSHLITVEVNTDTVRVHSEWYKLRSDKLVQ